MPITIQPTTLRYKNGNTFTSADCLKGDKGDKGNTGDSGVYYGTTAPTDPDVQVWINPDGNGTLIDDTAGAGDTDKTWSADKLVTEIESAGTVTDVQVNGTSILNQGVANIPPATTSTLGVVIPDPTNGVGIESLNKLYINFASSDLIKSGTGNYRPITPPRQHESVYFGLSKAAGVDLKNETVTVGTYPATAQSAIKSMLGVNVDDVQVNGTSVVSNGVANIPIASNSNLGVVKTENNYGILVAQSNGRIYIDRANTTVVKAGTDQFRPIVPATQNTSVYYGLAKLAGVDLANETVTVGTYPATAQSAIKSMLGVNVDDVQVNGTSVVSNGVANIPVASSTDFGVVKTSSTYGTGVSSANNLYIYKATATNIKEGSSDYRPVTPSIQHQSVFYGLAKASGDTTQSASSNAVGTYTSEAKAAIQSMLGVDAGVSLVETVSGTTPTITGQPNVRYICGEVSTLSITPPANGSIDVFFTSGSTATVLTVPSTVKFPVWFDPTSLVANTIYEIMITNGVYGAVMTWAS